MGFSDWLKDTLEGLFGGCNPPPRTVAQPRHVPRSLPSRSLADQSLARQVNGELQKANNLLGYPKGTPPEFIWPSREGWEEEFRQARQHRESAMRMILNNIANQQPRLKPFLNRIRYAPEKFDPYQTDKPNILGHTGGWADDPNKQPFADLNDSAFENERTLNRAIRHEIWHGIQRNNPQFYRDKENLRDFEAYLRDLENRNAFRLDAEEKLSSLFNSYVNITNAQRKPYWQKMTNEQREDYIKRFVAQRDALRSELANTHLNKTWEYRKIFGDGY